MVTDYGFDNTRFIRASIDRRGETDRLRGVLLMIIIIFLFLRNWRVTLIPCIVIPVSLIGTFFLICGGFSINVLSMLAVVLSVGLVVDDAIVMTENIYIRIERGMSPKEGGYRGAKEIFFAVIFDLHHADRGLLFPDRLHGGHDRASVPRVQSGDFGRRGHLDLRGADHHSDAGDQTARAAGEAGSWFYNKTEPFSSGSIISTAARWPVSCGGAG